MGAPSQPAGYKILVYGLDRKGLRAPSKAIESPKYTLEFGSCNDAPRFQEFSGVILFQGTFESFTRINGDFKTYLKHTCDRDELDKRTKESDALIEQGGFVCILLSDPFIRFDDRRDFSTTDLSKRLLISFGLTQRAFDQRMPLVVSKVNELGKFLQVYGAAWSHLSPGYRDTGTKVLASYGQGIPVGVVSNGILFALPTLIPAPTEEAITEYFTILSDGIVTLWQRLKSELPEWTREYRFPEEPAARDNKAALEQKLACIDARLGELDRFKRVLVLQGEPLVDAVMEVFERILPLKPRRREAFVEDLTLVDGNGTAVALVEVKGVSKGVAREYVNQVDSHRERTGNAHDFPALLVINTNTKNARSIAEKDQSVAAEQIRHAVAMGVLILRTLDLLNLAALHLRGALTADQVTQFLTQSKGWLRADADGVTVHSQ